MLELMAQYGARENVCCFSVCLTLASLLGLDVVGLRDARGQTLLHWAIDCMNGSDVAALIMLGADAEARDHKVTFLRSLLTGLFF